MSLHRGRGGIFISYRHEDTAGNAGRLYDRLTGRFGQDRVFMDIGSIEIGIDFTKAVSEAVGECGILLALIGPRWLALTDSRGRRRIDNPDDWVRVEIDTALKRDIRVVPVLVDGAKLPHADELPPSLRPLVLRQALELSYRNFQSEVTRLISVINEVFGDSTERSAEASQVRKFPKPSIFNPRTANRLDYRGRAAATLIIYGFILIVVLTVIISLFASLSHPAGP